RLINTSRQMSFSIYVEIESKRAGRLNADNIVVSPAGRCRQYYGGAECDLSRSTVAICSNECIRYPLLARRREVFYAYLTGRPASPGDTVCETLAAVVATRRY